MTDKTRHIMVIVAAVLLYFGGLLRGMSFCGQSEGGYLILITGALVLGLATKAR